MSTTALQTLSGKLAERFGLGADGGVLDTLKATAFKGPANDAQMTALLIVAQQYGLNPFTKEIYAFPDKNNGIVPVVGVDGWSRIINEHPQFDGLEFEVDGESCTCVIYRKDRAKPTKVTEYKDECSRNTGPWQSHPKRMLRHKALIQCARLAFGYTGIYDQDEAERIVEMGEKAGGRASGTVINGAAERVTEPQPYPADQFEKNLPAWRQAIAKGKDPEQIVAMVSTKGVLSEAQKAAIRAPAGEDAPAAVTFAQVEKKLRESADVEMLDAHADLIREIADEQQRAELGDLYRARREELSN